MNTAEFKLWKNQVHNHVAIFLMANGVRGFGQIRQQDKDQIMRLLPVLFMSLDRSGLIPRDFTYQLFYKAAFIQYQKAREIT